MAETFTPPGSTATVRTVQAKLTDRPLNLRDYYKDSDGDDHNPAISRALDVYSADRVNPPLLPAANGTGVIEIGRGNFRLSNQIVMSSVQGAGIIGHGEYSTTLIRNYSAALSGIYIERYNGVRFTDLSLFNESAERGESYGLFLNPVGGGGLLTVDRVTISGFHIGAFVAGDGNGDKSLWNSVSLVCNIGWSNGTNKQAIGHTFINPNGGCEQTFWEYGGAGATVALNGTINVFGSLLRLPENAGTPRGGMFALYGTKTEYHGRSVIGIASGNSADIKKLENAKVTGSTSGAVAYLPEKIVETGWTGTWNGTRAGPLTILRDSRAFAAGEPLVFAQLEGNAWVTVGTATATGTQTLSNLLIDARPSRFHYDAGGSAALVSLNQMWHASGPNDPGSDGHVIVKVGDGTSGADRIVVQARGCHLRGKVELASAVDGVYARTNRWVWEDNLSAPLPSEVAFQGVGSHALQQWSRNHNVPVDQYRGGQSFVGAIDFQKAYLWRHIGKALINTGVVGKTYGARVGEQFTIDGFPAKCTFTGLCAFVDVAAGSDTHVEWFATNGGTVWTDGVGGNVLLGAATIPGDFVGLFPVVMNDATKWRTGSEIHVRITKPGAGQITLGALVPTYFPYMGS